MPPVIRLGGATAVARLAASQLPRGPEGAPGRTAFRPGRRRSSSGHDPTVPPSAGRRLPSRPSPSVVRSRGFHLRFRSLPSRAPWRDAVPC